MTTLYRMRDVLLLRRRHAGTKDVVPNVTELLEKRVDERNSQHTGFHCSGAGRDMPVAAENGKLAGC